MAKEKKLVEAITSMDEDFAQWYTDVVKKAELCSYTSVKGCMAIKPAGYAIWENIQHELDRRFKETGVENVYMPMLIVVWADTVADEVIEEARVHHCPILLSGHGTMNTSRYLYFAPSVERIMKKKKEHFYDDYIKSLMAEARNLGITKQELIAMIEESAEGGRKDEKVYCIAVGPGHGTVFGCLRQQGQWRLHRWGHREDRYL